MSFSMSKRHLISVALALVIALSAWSLVPPPMAGAATPAEIDAALADGAAYLAGQQGPSGAWETSLYVGMTGLAVATLAHYAEHLGQNPLDPAYDYSSHIQAGLDYIFSPTSDSPVQRNAVAGRVWWGGASEYNGDNYVWGPAIMAIVMSGAPNKVVNVTGSAVYNMTYQQVVEEALNYIDWAQCKDDHCTGSWYYTGQGSYGDQSVAGWVTLGVGYARTRFGVDIPEDILVKLDQGIDIIQWTHSDLYEECYGGAGYNSDTTPPYNEHINIYKVGHLLYMMGLVGDTPATPRVQRSLRFLERYWNHPSNGFDSSVGCPDPGWRGNPESEIPRERLPSYIATVATMKGLVKLGIDRVGDYDWFDDFSDVIVENQNTDGSWTQGGCPPHYHDMLPTTWAMLTLMKATPEPPPPVGGTAYPSNKLLLLAPWIALAAVIAAGGLYLVRRRASS